jgi:hypothetical protein
MNGWTGTATLSSGDVVYFRSQDTWTGASNQILNATVSGVTYYGTGYGSGTKATLKPTSDMVYVVKLSASNLTFEGFDVDLNDQRAGGIGVGSYSAVSVSGFIIRNCAIHDSIVNNPPGDGDFVYAIHVGGYYDEGVKVSDVLIENCSIYDVAHEGIAIYPTWVRAGCSAENVTIRKCIVTNAGKNGDAWGTGLAVYNDSNDITLEFNTVSVADRGIGIGSSNTFTGSPDNIFIRYNILYDNSDAGLNINPNLESGNLHLYAYGNLIYNNYAVDVNIAGRFNDSEINLNGNTIYNSRSLVPAVIIGSFTDSTPSLTINMQNNIIVGAYILVQYKGNALGQAESRVNHTHNSHFRTTESARWIFMEDYETSYSSTTILTDYNEPTAQTSNPLFTGGTLPTGFTGTYGVNMVPNTDYFSIASGNAIGNGATLGYPYNGCINQAGYLYPGLRPAGSYDIGAYQNPSALLSTVPTLLGGTCQGCILTQ